MKTSASRFSVEWKTFDELDHFHQLALLAGDFARVAKDETALS